MNTPDTEWEKIVEETLNRLDATVVVDVVGDLTSAYLNHKVAGNILAEALTSRDTYWKERVGEITKDVCRYVERMEETVDWEWGNCREWQELYEAGTFPDFYDKVKALDTLLDNLK